MAFQLPPLPNFQVNTPQQPDILGQYGKMVQLKNMLGQQQLLPLQVQEEQQRVQSATTDNQIKQQMLNDQKAMGKWLQGEDADVPAPAKADPLQDKIASFLGIPSDDPLMNVARGWLKNGMSAPGVMTGLQASLQRREELAKSTVEQQKVVKDNYDTWKDALAPIANEKDPLKQSVALAEALPRLEGATHLSPELAGMLGALKQGPQYIQSAFNMVAAQEKALGLTKATAETKAAEQKVIPEGGAMSPDTAQQVQKDVAVATNPQIQEGKVEVATAEGQARANIEAAMARGSQAALANVPPHLITPASEAAQKAGAEYAQAVSVTQRLNAMMDAAKKGNVVSYQLIPQEGALQLTTSQGVHRINMAEIQNYGGGSLFQRMEGHFGKALTGKSIPESVLNDMAEMQKIQAEGSRAKYENTLKTVNQTFGASFKPVEMTATGKGSTYTPPANAPSATGPNGHKIVVDGGKWVDAETGKPI